jgi:hypothetical protein
MGVTVNGFNTGVPKIVGEQESNGTIVTGTTSATISATITIPANALATDSILEVAWSAVRSSGTNGSFVSRVYVNTSNSLTGATFIASGTSVGSTQYNVKNVRDIQKLNTSCQMAGLTGLSSDYSLFTSIFTFTLNNSSPVYFLFAIINVSTLDSTYINRIRITEYA